MELERAREELKTYGVLKQSLEKLENDARFAELAAMSPRASTVSPVPLHGGGRGLNSRTFQGKGEGLKQ